MKRLISVLCFSAFLLFLTSCEAKSAQQSDSSVSSSNTPASTPTYETASSAYPSPKISIYTYVNRTPEEIVDTFFFTAESLSESQSIKTAIKYDNESASLKNSEDYERNYSLEFTGAKVYLLVDEENYVRYVEAIFNKTISYSDCYVAALIFAFDPNLAPDPTSIFDDLSSQIVSDDDYATLTDDENGVILSNMNGYHYLTIMDGSEYNSDSYYEDRSDLISMDLIMITMGLME